MSHKKKKVKVSYRRGCVLPVLALIAVLCLALGACGGDSAGEPEETDAEVVASDASQPVVTDASTVTSDASEPAPGCGDGVKAGDEECDDHNNDSGDGCALNCSIESGFVCREDEAGKSSCECASGFDPDKNCADCLPGLWGDACQNSCPGKEDGAICSGNGDCDDGLDGTGECDCRDGMSGTNCSGCPGNFINYPDCDKCAAGYVGDNCDIPCPGLGTSAGVCSGKHGTCNDQGRCDCDEGFTGTNCEECAPGYFGLDCRPCSCHGRGQCESGINGRGCVCDSPFSGEDCTGCLSGFEGTNCENCDANHYGPGCASCPMVNNRKCNGHGTCGGSHDNTGCICQSPFTGDTCSQCLPGFTGPDCSECDADHYGPNCLPCPVVNGLKCNGLGTCGGKNSTGCACEPGYYGVDCNGCDADHYGPECTACPATNNGKCNGHGSCGGTSEDTGCSCDGNWDGVDCSTCTAGYSTNSNCQKCDSTHYGTRCQNTCPSTGSGKCNGHGSCGGNSPGSTGCSCDTGWGNSDCSRCDSTHYGTSCQTTCPSTSNGKCNGHGSCGGLLPGTTGCKCSENWGGDGCTTCASSNRYGNNCQYSCYSNSTKKVCSDHGTCSGGPSGKGCVCRNKWTGDMCQTCPVNYDDFEDCMMCWLQYYGINCQNSYSSSVNDPSGSDLSYYTIKIGSQIWMASNYERRAGVSNANICYTSIEKDDQHICYRLQLGVFYSWAAVKETNFCPSGWHMPSLAEMQALLRSITDYNASTQSVTTQNGILSFIANTALWKDYPNEGKDMRGFRPVPAGYLVASGSDTRTNYGTAAYFWTSESDPNDSTKAKVLVVRASASTTKISIESLKKTSLASVRCVKDY